MLGQMIDVPVGDGEVPDLFLPPAHQSSHGVLGEDGALAGQQLRTAEEEEHQQHLQSGVVRETGAYLARISFSLKTRKYKYQPGC